MDYWELISEAFDKVDIYNGSDAFFKGFAPLPKPIKHLLAAHWCQSEVKNGGFDQFFSNPTGVLAPEAEIGFRCIGLAEVADIVAEAIAAFGPEYPREREDRDAILNTMPRHYTESKFGGTFRHLERFDELDNRFYDALPDFGGPADAYATANTPISS